MSKAKAVQEPSLQPDLALGVHTQYAPHGERSGFGPRVARQGCGR
ncbi:hypothetical protein ACWCQW_43340 [Streptomyces mirabilis]